MRLGRECAGDRGLPQRGQPHWPEGDVYDLLNLHLSLTKGEVVARLEQNWDGDVAAFDEIFTEILTVADALSDGLVKQFPEKFAA